MKGLHQQLAEKRAELERCEALLADRDAEPEAQNHARESRPHLKQTIGELEASAIWGEEGISKIEAGLALLGNAGASRVMSLSITCFETGLWRLRQHLGMPEGTPNPERPAAAVEGQPI